MHSRIILLISGFISGQWMQVINLITRLYNQVQNYTEKTRDKERRETFVICFIIPCLFEILRGRLLQKDFEKLYLARPFLIAITCLKFT